VEKQLQMQGNRIFLQEMINTSFNTKTAHHLKPASTATADGLVYKRCNKQN